ncbi:MAG: HAD hydrolase-like protein, partial [Planctomycetota bacterium]
PRSGLLERACAEHELDPRRSWIVGDARRDLEAGLALGARAILVLTGKGERELAGMDGALRARISVARDLGEASAQILAGHAAQGR